MRIVTLDFETYYDREYSLRKMTPVEYILDPRFETNGCAVKWGAAPAAFLDGPAFTRWVTEQDWDNLGVVSHNALFDMCLLAWRYGVVPKLMIDTMGMARAMLSHATGRVSLEVISKHLGLPPKGGTIHQVIGMRAEDIRAAGLWGQYVEYACGDADNAYGIFVALRDKFPMEELLIMDMVLRCGIQPQLLLNRDRLQDHLERVVQDKQVTLAKAMLLGVNDKAQLMSNDQLADLLLSFGVTPPMKISKATGKASYAFAKTDEAFTSLLEHRDIRVQTIVAARLGVKSTIEETRTQKFLSIADLQWPHNPTPLRDVTQTGSWMPIPLRYSGAHTGRLSGDWKLNLQNMPRPKKGDPNSGALRRSLVAPPGHVVMTVDSSQIEARIVACLFGQDDLVQAFERGEDVYSTFASVVYGYPVNKNDNPVERFVGKQCLAKGTLVATDCGLVPIEAVTVEHKLWDGVEWVRHEGLLEKGWKQTLQLCGLSLTPDHRVWCGTQWQEAGLLARDGVTISQALATAAASWSSPVTSGVTGAASAPPSCSVRAAAPVYDIANAGPRHRFTVMTDAGPLIVSNCILGLGFGMGDARFLAQIRSDSFKQGLTVEMDELGAKRAVQTYRSLYTYIPAGWRALTALLPGIASGAAAGQTFGPLVIEKEAILLPSGLRVHYDNLRHEDDGWVYDHGYEKGIRLFGGKVTENVVQALARVIVMQAALRLKPMMARLGLQLALQVHDELVYVVPTDLVPVVRQLLLQEMCRRPSFMPNLPLAAEVGVGPSYGDAK